MINNKFERFIQNNVTEILLQLRDTIRKQNRNKLVRKKNLQNEAPICTTLPTKICLHVMKSKCQREKEERNG